MSTDAGLKNILVVGKDLATTTGADMDLGNHSFFVYSQFGGRGDTFGIFSWEVW